jgi:hypothetical protein
MSNIQKKVLIAGIKIKLARGELLEDILATYVKLIDEEKQEIRTELEA